MPALTHGLLVVTTSLANIGVSGMGGRWADGSATTWWDYATVFGSAMPLLWVYARCAFGYPVVLPVYFAAAAEGLYRGVLLGEAQGYLSALGAVALFVATRVWWDSFYVPVDHEGRHIHPDTLAEYNAKLAASPPRSFVKKLFFGSRPDPAAPNHGLVEDHRGGAAARTPAGKCAVKRVLVIVNPTAGSGNGAAAWKEAEQIFCEVEPKPELFVKTTTPDRKGTDLAASFTEKDIDVVVTCGGDGTISEVLNGLMRRAEGDRPPMGVIPGGTCNNFCHDLGLDSPAAAARKIVYGTATPVDAIKVHHNGTVTYSINTIAWGVGLRAVQIADQLGFLGPAKFDIGGLLAIITFYPTPVTSEFTLHDGTTKSMCGDFVIAMSQVCQRAGNGFRFGPLAKLNNGLMDTCMLKHVGVLRTLELFDEVKREGAHPVHYDTKYVQWKTMKFETETPTPISVDGEDTGTTPMLAETMPGLVKIFT